MTLLIAEGFSDLNDNAEMVTYKPLVEAITASLEIQTTDGLTNGHVLETAVDDAGIRFGVDSFSIDTIVMQFAFRHKFAGAQGINDDIIDYFLRIRNSSNTSHMEIQIIPGGILVFDDDATDLLAFIPYRREVWNYIKIKVFQSATVGTIDINLNGVDVYNGTGLDTISSGTNFDNFVLTANDLGGSDGFQFEDIVVHDDNFQNTTVIASMIPTTDGTNTAWTPNGGTNNVDRVDDPFSGSVDDDTTYLDSSTVDQQNDVNIGTLSEPFTIGAIQTVMHRMIARFVTSGNVNSVIERGGSSSVSGDITITSGYIMYDTQQATDPNGGGAWSETNVNDVEIGMRFRT